MRVLLNLSAVPSEDNLAYVLAAVPALLPTLVESLSTLISTDTSINLSLVCDLLFVINNIAEVQKQAVDGQRLLENLSRIWFENMTKFESEKIQGEFMELASWLFCIVATSEPLQPSPSLVEMVVCFLNSQLCGSITAEDCVTGLVSVWEPEQATLHSLSSRLNIGRFLLTHLKGSNLPATNLKFLQFTLALAEHNAYTIGMTICKYHLITSFDDLLSTQPLLLSCCTKIVSQILHQDKKTSGFITSSILDSPLLQTLLNTTIPKCIYHQDQFHSQKLVLEILELLWYLVRRSSPS